MLSAAAKYRSTPGEWWKLKQAHELLAYSDLDSDPSQHGMAVTKVRRAKTFSFPTVSDGSQVENLTVESDLNQEPLKLNQVVPGYKRVAQQKLPASKIQRRPSTKLEP